MMEQVVIYIEKRRIKLYINGSVCCKYNINTQLNNLDIQIGSQNPPNSTGG